MTRNILLALATVASLAAFQTTPAAAGGFLIVRPFVREPDTFVRPFVRDPEVTCCFGPCSRPTSEETAQERYEARERCERVLRKAVIVN